jgi:hypothetical protein
LSGFGRQFLGVCVSVFVVFERWTFLPEISEDGMKGLSGH